MNRGDPIKIKAGGGAFFGRFDRQEGGIIHMITPSGSELTAGLVWVSPVGEEDLTFFEESARRLGAAWYAGKFGPDPKASPLTALHNGALLVLGLPVHCLPGATIYFRRGDAVVSRVVEYIELGCTREGGCNIRMVWDREYLYPNQAFETAEEAQESP